MAVPIITIKLNNSIFVRDKGINTEFISYQVLRMINYTQFIKNRISQLFKFIWLNSLLLYIHLQKHTFSTWVIIPTFKRAICWVIKFQPRWRYQIDVIANLAGQRNPVSSLPIIQAIVGAKSCRFKAMFRGIENTLTPFADFIFAIFGVWHRGLIARMKALGRTKYFMLLRFRSIKYFTTLLARLLFAIFASIRKTLTRTKAFFFFKASCYRLAAPFTYYCPEFTLISHTGIIPQNRLNTQKPVALLQYLIRTYTNPGDLILDNAAGSFTTGVAAIKEGRRFVGIEKELEYCQIGRERIIEALFAAGKTDAANGQDTLKDGYQIGFNL